MTKMEFLVRFFTCPQQNLPVTHHWGSPVVLPPSLWWPSFLSPLLERAAMSPGVSPRSLWISTSAPNTIRALISCMWSIYQTKPLVNKSQHTHGYLDRNRATWCRSRGTMFLWVANGETAGPIWLINGSNQWKIHFSFAWLFGLFASYDLRCFRLQTRGPNAPQGNRLVRSLSTPWDE